jgi:hypothetical protein
MAYRIVESLTDPQEHDPSEYLYIGHSVQCYKAGELDEFGVNAILEHLTSTDNYFSACLLGKSEGRMVNEFGWDFPHTIEQTATHTFVGFLLQPQDEIDAEWRIPIAWNCDLGSPMDQTELRTYVDQYRGQKRSLYQLMTQSLGASRELPRNELIVQGTPESIVGVFYVDVRGQKNFKEDGEALSAQTNDVLGRELPLIEIVYEPPKLSEEEDIERTVKDQAHLHALSNAIGEFKEGRERMKVPEMDRIGSSSKASLDSYLENLDPEILRRLLASYRL